MKLLQKIVTFVTENGEAENWISKWGNRGGKRKSTMRSPCKNMVADSEETRNGATGEEF